MLPGKKCDKEKLDTVPSTEELLSQQLEMESLLKPPIKAITFMGLDEDEVSIKTSSASDLPLQYTRANTVHVMKNYSYYAEAIDTSNISTLDRSQRAIHAKEIYNIIFQQLYSIIINYLEASKLIDIISGDSAIYTQNIKYQIMSGFRAKFEHNLDMIEIIIHATYNESGPSAYKGTDIDGNVDESSLEKIAAYFDLVAAQISQIIVAEMCNIVESAFKYTINMMDVNTCASKLEEACKVLNIELGETETGLVKDFPKQSLVSFISSHLKNEMVDLSSQIEDCVSNTMEGFVNTGYYIFDDIEKFKMEDKLGGQTIKE